jgi:hypothetical protein
MKNEIFLIYGIADLLLMALNVCFAMMSIKKWARVLNIIAAFVCFILAIYQFSRFLSNPS